MLFGRLEAYPAGLVLSTTFNEISGLQKYPKQLNDYITVRDSTLHETKFGSAATNTRLTQVGKRAHKSCRNSVGSSKVAFALTKDNVTKPQVLRTLLDFAHASP